jgi:hypothetical protein
VSRRQPHESDKVDERQVCVVCGMPRRNCEEREEGEGEGGPCGLCFYTYVCDYERQGEAKGEGEGKRVGVVGLGTGIFSEGGRGDGMYGFSFFG